MFVVQDLKTKLIGAVDAGQELPQGEMNYLVCSTYSEFTERVSTGSVQLTTM